MSYTSISYTLLCFTYRAQYHQQDENSYLKQRIIKLVQMSTNSYTNHILFKSTKLPAY